MEELKESFKQAVFKRIDSPLFGFIALSWISANWDNILTLILSKEPIEKSIYIIMNQDDSYYINRLLLPVLAGSLLAIAYPYLQLVLDGLHSQARKTRNKKNTESIIEELQNKIDISIIKAQADMADERAKSNEQNNHLLSNEIKKTEIEQEKEKQTKAKLNIDELEAQYDSIKNENNKLISDSLAVEKKYSENIIKCGQIIELIEQFNKIENSQSLNKLKAELSNIINDDSIRKAKNLIQLNNTFERVQQNRNKQSQEHAKNNRINTISFDYSTNNGIVKTHDNDIGFSLRFSKADSSSLYLYTHEKIKRIARVKNPVPNQELFWSHYDSTSNNYSIRKGEVFLAEDKSGRTLVGKIKDITDDSRGSNFDSVTFEYVIYDSDESIISI